MTWTRTAAQPAPTLLPSSVGPHTPPPSICPTAGTIMDPYIAASWSATGVEFDPYLGDGGAEDPLLSKALAPLSLNSHSKPPSPPPSKRIDMRLAQPGTEESKPGYMTPLASYTAQTFWYFWYADMFVPPADADDRRVSEDLQSSTSRPFDSQGLPRHKLHGSLHPNQLQPNAPFCQFVFTVLQSTQVSFSVTILALMYTYKYKKVMAMGRRKPYKTQVSESQGFVTGLMLANKYLDDNTYTNTTWAQFLGITDKEVNQYELHWLDVLQFNLCVRMEEFETWRSMLDAHIRTIQRNDAALASAMTSPSTRARSESPPLGYYSPPGLTRAPEHARKRSARDAFAADPVHHSGMYEAARLGARKSSFASLGGVQFPTPVTALPTPASLVQSSSTLGRSASLNRQIARLPNGTRHDSAGHGMSPADAELWQSSLPTWQFPLATVNGHVEQRPQPQPRLYFLQAAATPMNGPDGRFHKGIPHYFDPTYGTAVEMPMGAPDMMDVDVNHVDLASPTDCLHIAGMPPMMVAPLAMPQPHPTGHPYAFGEPQPAQFANAGPPGYAYGAPGWPQPYPAHPQHQQQHQQHQHQQQLQHQWQRQWKPGHMSRWSASSEEGLMFNLPRAPMCRTEWPTPVHVGF